MTRQVLDLTGLDAQDGWRGAVLIDPALIVGGGVAYLRHVERVGNSIRVRLGASETDDPLDAGPQFTTALERADEAFTFVGSDGATLVLKGPGHLDNTFADFVEPYFWTPDNGAAMNAWFLDRTGAFTLTLDDGMVPVVEIRGAAAAGAAETAATVARVALAVLALQGAAAAGAAETAATVDQVQLALADFDTTGLEVDMLALLRAGAGSAGNGGVGTIFALPPRGVVGALLDGDIGLGPDDEHITRIRRRSSTLAFNDNGPLSLADYFGAGGDGADLTLTIQTTAGLASFPASSASNAGDNFLQFRPTDPDNVALIRAIADGQSFIVAFTRPAPVEIAVSGAAAAGEAHAAATVARLVPAVRALAGTAAAGAAQARAHVRAAMLPVRALRGSAAAGAAEAVARVSAIRALRGLAAAGAAQVRARVRAVMPPVRAVRGAAAAGGAEATARMAAVRMLRGRAAAGRAQARVRLTRIGHVDLRGVAASGAPQARARVAAASVYAVRGRARAGRPIVLARLRATAAGVLYERSLRASAPADRLLTALEIVHPAVARPVRVVNDTVGRTIEGNDYVALRFDARLADDIAGQAPQAELAIDNVGRALTQWIEATGGGIGATVRVLQVLAVPDPPVEWEATLDVAAMTVDQERVSARLGFDPLLGRAAVALRHDPQTSPGLF